MTRIRPPAVAGSFYEADRDALVRQIEWCFKHPLGPGATPSRSPDARYSGAPIVVVPHAGYIFSGPVAAHAYAELYRYHDPEVVIIVGPNHYGVGAPVAIADEGVWKTPLGEVEVATDIAREIAKLCKSLEIDWYAFQREHSIEVQLPFLQYLYNGKFKIVPIALIYQEIDIAECVGRAIAEVMKRYGPGRIVLVASSDWTHYEPHEVAVRKDTKAIEKVLSLDLKGFYTVINQYSVSACGYGAVGIAIVTAREIGVKEVRLLKYATSGDVIKVQPELYGDLALLGSEEVVGYAAIAFYI